MVHPESRESIGGPREARELRADRAFEQDALRCLDDVARFARSLSRGDADADDLVQETFLRAFRGRHTWKEGSDMRRWLFTICKNVFLRANDRLRDAVSVDDDPSGEALAAAQLHNELVASGDASLFDRIDVGPAIVRAMQDLPPSFRMVIVLVDMEGYDYADAATALEIPVGTVRSRLFRGRRLLQETLVAHAHDAGIRHTFNNAAGSKLA
jgi:RNA polymerase sigma-70 factor, ECF subfamily